MGKEYSYLSNSYMFSLINEINKHAKYGWRLINVFHDGCEFIAVSEDINCGILSRNPVNWKLNKVHVIRLINQ